MNRSEEKDLKDMLWKLLLADPNEPTILEWWYRFHCDSEGQVRGKEALRRIAQEKGGWLAEVWLSRQTLFDRKLGEALKLYRRILAEHPQNGLALQEISGHLGEAGYYREMLDLIFPLYDPSRHGPIGGLNLLQASVDAGDTNRGRLILTRMKQQNWPEVRSILELFDKRLNVRNSTMEARYKRN